MIIHFLELRGGAVTINDPIRGRKEVTIHLRRTEIIYFPLTEICDVDRRGGRGAGARYEDWYSILQIDRCDLIAINPTNMIIW
jgi:hypothetical protein